MRDPSHGTHFRQPVIRLVPRCRTVWKELIMPTPLILFLAAILAQSGPVLYQVDGLVPNQATGGAIAVIEDLTGDGINELLIGGERYSSPGPTLLVSGANGRPLTTFTEPFFGDAVADCGDVNGDLVHDLIIGDMFAAATPHAAGKAWVYSGVPPYPVLYAFQGTQADQYLGGAVTGLGDLNNDGHDDFAIGSDGKHTPTAFAGMVEIYSGIDGSVMRTFTGIVDHGYFGESISFVEDVDGDGHRDLLIGATGEGPTTDEGVAYLYSSVTGTLLHKWQGAEPYDRMGTKVASAGDANQDGIGDALVGAIYAGGNGEVYVFSGADGSELVRVRGYDPGEVLGSSLAGGYDLDGDLHDDFIVGSDHYYAPGGWTGFVRAYSGLTGDMLQLFSGGSPTARLGMAVAMLGDVNHDGVCDLAAGAIDQDTPNGSETGRVFVFSGIRQGLLFEVADLEAGSSPRFRLSGCAPSSYALFAYSLTGPGPSSSPFGPVYLSPPIGILPYVACNANGVGELVLGPLPPSVVGLPVWAQAFELYAGGGGMLSHPLELEIH